MTEKRWALKESLALCFFILLFVLVSLAVWQYGEIIGDIIGRGGFLSVAIYFVFAILSEVVAPISSLPALPLAVIAWGSFWAAIISWAGWLTGSFVAFYLARRFGQPIIKRLVSLDKVREAASLIPDKNLFWIVVFLRMFFPADIFSYALGLFSKISGPAYFWATALGLAPFTFLFSYGLKMPIGYQITIGAIAVVATLLFYRRAKKAVGHWMKEEFKK